MLSLLMTVISGNTLIGNAAEQYTYGIQGMWQYLGSGVAYIMGTIIYAPFFYKLKPTSIYEVHYTCLVQRLVSSRTDAVLYF